MSIAAVTIVSRNYLSTARVLARSYAAVHPDSAFYVFICDELDGVDAEAEPFQLLSLADVPIPGPAYFFTQYSVMEANTAVKPFVLDHLLFTVGHEKVAYIDPDIQMFQPMSEMWAALDDSSIVLTPHMRQPLADDKHPTELGILQSGTYNLGFVGLKADETARRFLEWWQERLYRDCIVDIPRGLFVDQKWVDLVPGYFQAVHILHAPTYNVAYWNLHDREVVFDGDTPTVDGQPLVFFHFSGYSPFFPDRLSKHQNRHDLADLPGVRRLCDGYGARLLEEDHVRQSAIPYAWATLPNGVKVSGAVRRALRRIQSRGLTPPDPWADADGFTDALMTIDEIACERRWTPLQRAVLEERPDVANAFPAVHGDPFDEGFWLWMDGSGRTEVDAAAILDRQPRPIEGDLVQAVFTTLDARDRGDVYEAFSELWFDDEVWDDFCVWIENQGPLEVGLTKAHGTAMRAARNGPLRLLKLYLSAPDLQAAFPELQRPERTAALRNWLAAHAPHFGLSIGEISLFGAFCVHNGERLHQIVSLYGTAVKGRLGRPVNAWSIATHGGMGPADQDAKLLKWLLKPGSIDAVDQARSFLFQPPVRAGRPIPPPLTAQEIAEDLADARRFGRVVIPEPQGRDFLTLTERATREAGSTAGDDVINVAGFFDAATGMGYWARSLLDTIAQTDWSARTLSLPTVHDRGAVPSGALPFGWPSTGAKLSITVANADSQGLVDSFCPSTHWARRNVGCWVWEVENFPPRFAENARRYDAIWTLSRHAASAIAAQVDVPVRVLPCVVDVEALAHVKGDRRAFGLSPDVTAFGFFFDPKSVLERKNPLGVVRAFRQAFGNADDVLLVLKVNGATSGDFAYQRFRSEVMGLNNVRLIEATWSYDKVMQLMASLDVYVSLHRSEGQGLTCAEAMAMGVPTIATDYSGNTDFMDADSALMVPAKVFSTARPHGAYPRGSRWGEPDLEVAARHMRMLTDAATRARLGEAGRQMIGRTLSAAVLARRFEALVEELDV